MNPPSHLGLPGVAHTVEEHNLPAAHDKSYQNQRPRRRKLVAAGFIALVLSLFLFLGQFSSSSRDADQLQTAEFPSFVDTSHSFEYIATPTPTAVAKTATVHQNASVEAEPVVFVLIIWSEPSAAEGALLIKSILLYNTSPSEIHIICDDSAHKILQARLSLVNRPSRNVRVFFYKPSWHSMLERVEREGSIKTDHSAGLPGLMKLFIHEIIPPTVKKGIYIDTDALLIADPTLLWEVFDNLKPSTAIVMASHPDQDSPEWHHASRICSCVMLLDLEKLRAMRIMDSTIYRNDSSGKFPPAMSPPAFKAKYGLPGADGHGRYDNVRLGDQGYWWAIVDYHRHIFEPLSYDFEVTSCLLDTYLTGLGDDSIAESEELSRQIHTKDTLQEGIVVLPKLLHFNCLDDIYMNWSGWSDPRNSLTIRWGAAVAYHSGFKWIWLNTGNRRNATLQTFVISNVTFADELFARNHEVDAVT